MSAAAFAERRGAGFQTRDASVMVVGRQGGGGGASNRLHRHGGCDDYCHHSKRRRAGISLLARLQPRRPSPTFLRWRRRGPLRLQYWAGPFGSITVGLIAGAATLVIGQFIFATIRSPLPRALMTATFALPAAVAGYHLVLGLSAIGMASDPWRHLFAIIGAIVVGATAWARFIAHPFEKPERIAESGLPQS
jgi:hypothetical protein